MTDEDWQDIRQAVRKKINNGMRDIEAILDENLESDEFS